MRSSWGKKSSSPQFESNFCILTVMFTREAVRLRTVTRQLVEKDGPALKFRVTCVDRVAVGEIVVVLPAVQRLVGFRYRSVLHNTAANSAAKIRTMETAAESTELTSKELADVDFNEIKSELRENEKWKNIGNIVGDENEWKETVKRWQTEIENLIQHNVDMSECYPLEMITFLDEEPVRNGLQALADVTCLVVKILGHCKLDIFGITTNGAITKYIQLVTSKYRVGIYVDSCLAYPRLTIMSSLSICLSLLRRI